MYGGYLGWKHLPRFDRGRGAAEYIGTVPEQDAVVIDVPTAKLVGQRPIPGATYLIVRKRLICLPY